MKDGRIGIRGANRDVIITLAEICLLRGAIVSFPEENTLSQGTLEPWIGIISIASQNM